MKARFPLVVCALALLGTSRAGDDGTRSPPACPRCARLIRGPAARCPGDGEPLVRSGLVVLHETLTRLAAFSPREEGFENPFARLVTTEGQLDATALERLVLDYKAARAQGTFAVWSGSLPLVAPPRPEDEEASVVAQLRAIAAAEAVYRGRSGTRAFGSLEALARANLVDSALVPGKWGYAFSVGPASSAPGERWWALARPERGRGRWFFADQSGQVLASERAVEVDESTGRPRGALAIVR